MFQGQYKEKLRTPDEAVKVIKSGDWVDYGFFNGAPKALDRAMAKRKEELFGVHLLSGLCLPPLPEAPLTDDTLKHFQSISWHFGGFETMLADRSLCSYSPMLYHELPGYYRRREVEIDVAMIRVHPMDKYGFFNFGINTSQLEALCENARIVILEENENVPFVFGGSGHQIHISDVDFVVRGENELMASVPPMEATEAEAQIAEFLVSELKDGCCIQLGIGGLPNYLGKKIAEAGFKDLGVHTEMMADAYYDLWRAGSITNKKKEIDRGRMVCAFGLGSQELYDFMDHNAGIATYSVDYTNNPYIISKISNMVSINACLEADFYGQVTSEMQGSRQLTGTGGQWDFVYGAYHSPGGKSFLCMPSTYRDSEGRIQSKIKPFITPGAALTVTRQMTHHIVTEWGIARLKSQSVWKRTENMISVAHPDFRDELIDEASRLGFWKRTNRIEP